MKNLSVAAVAVAKHIVRQGTERTDNGSWNITTCELASELHVSEQLILDMAGDVLNTLENTACVAAVEYIQPLGDGELSGEFSMVFSLAYCSQWDGTDAWGCF